MSQKLDKAWTILRLIKDLEQLKKSTIYIVNLFINLNGFYAVEFNLVKITKINWNTVSVLVEVNVMFLGMHLFHQLWNTAAQS